MTRVRRAECTHDMWRRGGMLGTEGWPLEACELFTEAIQLCSIHLCGYKYMRSGPRASVRFLSMQALRAVLLLAGRQLCYPTPRNSALTTSSWCCPILLPCIGSRLHACAVQTQLDVLVGYTCPTLRSAKPSRQCVDVAGEHVQRHPVWVCRRCRLLTDFSSKAAYSRPAPGKQSQRNPMYSTKCVRRSLAGLPVPVPLHQPSSMQRWQLRLRASPSTRLNGIAGSKA